MPVSTLRRVLLWVAGLLGVLLLGVGIWIGPAIYRAVHGMNVYETTPPQLPADLLSPAILVFSKTNGFRHESIAAANAMFRDIATEREWGIYLTENGAVFDPALLSRFDAVVWNNASGDVLTPEQRQAFQDYLRGGGGFVGVHGAGGDPSYRWRWYVDELIGAQFIGHTMWPQFPRAAIQIADPTHPAMQGLPREWVRDDEWYSFDRSVREKGYRILATLDEGSYRPRGLLLDDLSMAGDHPIIWSHCVGDGRALYSALGHSADAYSEPLHRTMLASAVAWAANPGSCVDGR
jgi:type 1 glutamine amidotransferase